MISRYEVYMNGIALSSIDPSILVLDVQPGDVKRNIQTSKIANRPGARIIKTDDESETVTVQFEIHEYDTVKRQEICQRIRTWAKEGTLCVSDRPEQQLECVCETFPKANAKAWTEALTMTFVAYNPPYWQEKNPTVVSFTGSDNKSVYVPGNVPYSFVSVVVTAGAALSHLNVQVGTDLIVIADLDAVANDVISIGYDDNKIMYIKKNSTSVLHKRTATSADDLKAKCGQVNTFVISSSGAFTAEMRTRGCWY